MVSLFLKLHPTVFSPFFYSFFFLPFFSLSRGASVYLFFFSPWSIFVTVKKNEKIQLHIFRLIHTHINLFFLYSSPLSLHKGAHTPLPILTSILLLTPILLLLLPLLLPLLLLLLILPLRFLSHLTPASHPLLPLVPHSPLLPLRPGQG